LNYTEIVDAIQEFTEYTEADFVSNIPVFVKLAEAIDGRDAKWVKAAAAAPDIDKQINDTRELFKLCK